MKPPLALTLKTGDTLLILYASEFKEDAQVIKDSCKGNNFLKY